MCRRTTAREPFIKQIVKQSGKVPCVILYNDFQIDDIKRFCCAPESSERTVLGIDKTYNLGPVHVTATVFKNIAVLRQRTGMYPIFCGPVFLRGNSDTETLFVFLQHLSGKFLSAMKPPVLGSDAIGLAFPNSPRLSCTQHLKENLKDYFVDNARFTSGERSICESHIWSKRTFGNR